MKLPNYDRVLVPSEKITHYLLSVSHKDGRHKAAFFMRFGFAETAWRDLALALRHHAQAHEVVQVVFVESCKRIATICNRATPYGLV
jgi:hypothetical protein